MEGNNTQPKLTFV